MDGHLASTTPPSSIQFIMRSATIVLAFSALLAQSAIAAPHAFVAPRQGRALDSSSGRFHH